MGLIVLVLGEVAQHVAELVIAAPLHRRPVAEDLVDRLRQGLRAVDQEHPPPLRIEATRDQIGQQQLRHLGVLRGPFAEAQDVLVGLGVDAHRADHMRGPELDPIDPDGQDVELREVVSANSFSRRSPATMVSRETWLLETPTATGRTRRGRWWRRLISIPFDVIDCF